MKCAKFTGKPLGSCPTYTPSVLPHPLPDFSAQDLRVLQAIKYYVYADSTPRAAEPIKQQTTLRQQKLLASLPSAPSLPLPPHWRANATTNTF
jgi:hypothetical protein